MLETVRNEECISSCSSRLNLSHEKYKVQCLEYLSNRPITGFPACALNLEHIDRSKG